MKRSVRILALLLSLMLCAFAFASCGKKKTASTTAEQATGTPTAAATTAEPTAAATTTAAAPTQPSHVHTPEANPTVDLKPTCSTPGEQSYYCEECGEKIPGTTEPIPIDPDAHNIPEWVVTKEATIFEDGLRTGTCNICDTTFEETYSSIVEVVYTSEPKDAKHFAQTAIFNDILEEGEKHFYPTDANPSGLDLFVEYSILWNPTLKNINNGDPIYSTRIGGLSDAGSCNDVIWMSLKDAASGSDCIFAGGYEYGGLRTVDYGPVTMSTPVPSNKTFDCWPNIGGAIQADYDNLNNGHEWGWHRVGVRMHQELLNEDELKAYDATSEEAAPKAKYLLWAECYIDGTLIFKLSNAETTVNGASTYKEENMFFTAEANGEGGVAYTDISEAKYVMGIRLIAKSAEGNAYFVYGDYYATAGSAFKQTVTKVASPAAATYTTADGTEISAPCYYSIVTD